MFALLQFLMIGALMFVSFRVVRWLLCFTAALKTVNAANAAATRSAATVDPTISGAVDMTPPVLTPQVQDATVSQPAIRAERQPTIDLSEVDHLDVERTLAKAPGKSFLGTDARAWWHNGAVRHTQPMAVRVLTKERQAIASQRKEALLQQQEQIRRADEKARRKALRKAKQAAKPNPADVLEQLLREEGVIA